MSDERCNQPDCNVPASNDRGTCGNHDSDKPEPYWLARALTLADGLDGGGYAWASFKLPGDRSAVSIDADDLADCGYLPDRLYVPCGTVIAIDAMYASPRELPDAIAIDADTVMGGTDVRGTIFERDVECFCVGSDLPDDVTCDRCNGDGYVDGPPVLWRLYASADDDDWNAIVESAARALWALSWGDACERMGVSLSGLDLCDAAPEAPDAVVSAVVSALDRTATLAAFAAQLAPNDAAEFGHYVAMEAAGHGVAWTDSPDREPHGLQLPDVTAAQNEIDGALYLCERLPDDPADDDDAEQIAELRGMCRTTQYGGADDQLALLRAILTAAPIDSEALSALDTLAARALERSPLDLADYLLDMHGVESTSAFSYANAGETYARTIVRFDRAVSVRWDCTSDEETHYARGQHIACDWGSVVEAMELAGDSIDE